MKNIAIDWRIFEYKFSANPQSAFESLSYTLFCHEFNQKQGIFRYFNQPYIETMPIDTNDGFTTGFQAKYYEPATSLASKKSELNAAIKGAHEKYPQLNRMIIYTNKELSVSTQIGKTKPKYQDEIEQFGDNLGITVEWRVKSNFEIMLASDKLRYARELYFDPNSELQNFCEDISKHSQIILDKIKSKIKFNKQEIKNSYDQNELFEFLDSDAKAFLIFGDAGTGKSGLVKDFLENEKLKSKKPNILMFSSSDFDIEDEILLFKNYGNYRLDDIFSIFKDEKDKIFIIDSAEKYCNFRRPDIFKSIIKKIVDNNWKIIFTIRTAYKEGFCNFILGGIQYNSFCIKNISKEVLLSLGKTFGFELPENNKLRSLLCDLFNLKLYLNLIGNEVNIPATTESFMNGVWDTVIRNSQYTYNGLPLKRENFVIKMVYDMLRNGSYIYRLKDEDDFAVIVPLENDSIIFPCNESRDLWAFSHDIYEELVFKHIFSEKYNEFDNVEKFFNDLENSFYSRKMFRIWLKTKLEDKDNKIFGFLTNVLQDQNLEQSWKDETLIALMSCDNSDAFYIMGSMFSSDDYKLFTRAVFLLNTACRCLDARVLKWVENKKINNYRFATPTGLAWGAVFAYINKNKNLIAWSENNLGFVVEALKSWVTYNSEGKTVRLAGEIALFLKHKIWIENSYWHFKEVYSDIIEVILKSTLEVKEELSSIFINVIENKSFDSHSENNLLIRKALSNINECGNAWYNISEIILKLAKAFWTNCDNKGYYGGGRTELDFGQNPHMDNDYYPSSAYQTPIYYLLKISPRDCIDFIVDLTNYCANTYKESSLNADYNECHEIQIKISKTETIIQICSDRLWKIHRGSGVAQDLLESVLMALERWMLEYVKDISDDDATALCLYLLKRSNNAAITSLVLSVVMAFPDRLFDISCILLKTKEIFYYDILRQQAESSLKHVIGYTESKKVFYIERADSLKLPFRKNLFENIILNYQLNNSNMSAENFSKRCNKLYTAIEETITDIASWETCFQFVYYRMDLRKLILCSDPVKNGDDLILSLKANLPEPLDKVREKNEERTMERDKYAALFIWALNRYNEASGKYESYSQYESNPSAAYSDAKSIIDGMKSEKSIYEHLDFEAALYTCAVLLRDFCNQLNNSQRAFCKSTILEIGYSFLKEPTSISIYSFSKIIIYETARMASSFEFKAEYDNPWFVLLGLMIIYCKNYHNYIDISELIWNNENSAKHFISVFVQIAPQCSNEDIFTLFENDKSMILNAFSNNIDTIENINTDALDYNSLLFLHLMLNSNTEYLINFIVKNGNKVWNTLFNDDHSSSDSSINYGLECSYIEWLANYTLNLAKEQQTELVHAIMESALPGRNFGYWLSDLIIVEGKKPNHDSFWNVWQTMQEYIIMWYDKQMNRYKEKSFDVYFADHMENVLMNYLLAFPYWSEGREEWCSLKQENSSFYYVMSIRLGYNPTTLCGIAQILNTIGKKIFINNGIDWLSYIIINNQHLLENPLPLNTIYYIEEYMFGFAKKENFSLKNADTDEKKKALIILDFLVSKGSMVGFLLRDTII